MHPEKGFWNVFHSKFDPTQGFAQKLTPKLTKLSKNVPFFQKMTDFDPPPPCC